jgi:putative transposase
LRKRNTVGAIRSAQREIGTTPNIGDIDPAIWAQARERAAAVHALIAQGAISQDAAAHLARQWQVSRSTVWRRIERYRSVGDLTAFLPRRAGRKEGGCLIDSAADEIIQAVARKWWRRSENATVAEIEPEVVHDCIAQQLPPPSRATISRRLRKLRQDPENFSGEARQVLRERRRLMKSSYEVAAPLDVVQMDHTVADVFIVDPESRQCIGRPTLTVAIDVATRCILGSCLSLEAPSALLVALCMDNAVFPKENTLATLNLTVDYPMHGLPTALHTDNGQEFHSEAFRRGCDLHNINTIYRPPGTPRFGGHVERLIGTLMRRFRLLPGNTYSDLLKRRPAQAEAKASLALIDLHRFLLQEIARYHHQTHRSLGMSPRRAWERGWSENKGRHQPSVPRNRQKFLLDFLPVRQRVVGREGIELFGGLKYASPELAEHVALHTKRIVRFDPRDISRVYLECANAAHLVVPWRDRFLAPMSLWEWDALRERNRPVTERGDRERTNTELQRLRSAAPLRKPRALKSRRHAARAADWHELQRLQALPSPTVALEATITVDAEGEALAWEVLE